MANPYFIKIELPEEGAKSAVAGSGTGSTGGDKASEGAETPDNYVKAAKRLVSYSTIKSTANTLISNGIRQVALETGAAEFEQRANAIHSMVNQGLSTAVTLGTGIATGNLPLVMVGLLTSGLNTIMNISAKQKQIDTQQGIENVAIGMATIRAGVSGRRSSNQ